MCNFAKGSKAWNNLKTAAEAYPQWVAAITGKMGEAIAGGFRLENPSVQIFEKKPKLEAAAPEPPPAPPAAPATGCPTLSLKGRA